MLAASLAVQMASLTNLARTGADVIALSELTPDSVRRSYDAGMRDLFPYTALVPCLGPGAWGLGLWSRCPLKVIPPPKGEAW